MPKKIKTYAQNLEIKLLKVNGKICKENSKNINPRQIKINEGKNILEETFLYLYKLDKIRETPAFTKIKGHKLNKVTGINGIMQIISSTPFNTRKKPVKTKTKCLFITNVIYRKNEPKTKTAIEQ